MTFSALSTEISQFHQFSPVTRNGKAENHSIINYAASSGSGRIRGTHREKRVTRGDGRRSRYSFTTHDTIAARKENSFTVKTESSGKNEISSMLTAQRDGAEPVVTAKVCFEPHRFLPDEQVFNIDRQNLLRNVTTIESDPRIYLRIESVSMYSEINSLVTSLLSNRIRSI